MELLDTGRNFYGSLREEVSWKQALQEGHFGICISLFFTFALYRICTAMVQASPLVFFGAGSGKRTAGVENCNS